MRFEDLLGDGHLWGTIYDGKEKDALSELFDKWEDIGWLKTFFENNLMDLKEYFRITDVNQAIYDTLDDAEELRCLIFDIKPEERLSYLFRQTLFCVQLSSAGSRIATVTPSFVYNQMLPVNLSNLIL